MSHFLNSSNAAVSYFGKIPSRGDFVRYGHQHQLIAWLDRWAGESLELMSQALNWKQLYDQAPAGHFAFLGTRSKTALCGHVRPSRDSSGRRFPMLAAARVDVSEPTTFLARSVLLMQPAWALLSEQVGAACMDEEATPALTKLANLALNIPASQSAADAEFSAFLEHTNVGDLQTLLRDAGYRDAALKHLIPALGMLLQPVLAGGSDAAIDKALVFPLPTDPQRRVHVAAFWLELLKGFLSRADFELAVLIADDAQHGMLVGFNGADRQILRAAMDPAGAGDFLIHITQSDWVEPYLASDFNLNRLASYLERGELALSTARQLFAETFLGV